MFGKFRKAAVIAAAASLLLHTTAFADVIFAPGAGGNSGAGGPGATVEIVQGTDAPSGGPSASVSSPVSSQSTAVPVQNSSAPVQSAPPAAQNSAASVQMIGPGGGPAGAPGVPVSSSQGAPVNMASGGGSAGEGVYEDPILGTVPLINAVMIDTAGMAEHPFSTDSGMYTSTSDGFSGLWLCYDRAVGDVYYRVYTDEHGWGKWAMNEMRTPNYGDGSKVTALEIRTTGHTSNLFSIFYKAVLNDGTELGWARDGQAAGAFGTGKYIQSLEIRLYKRGTGATGAYQQGAAYEGVQFGADGRPYYSTFDGRAFTGWAYDIDDNKYYFSNNAPVSGWQYIDGYKYYFNDNGRVVTDLEPIIGITGDYIIKINKSMKTMTIYGKDGDNGYIMPVKVILNTIGKETPIGTFKTYEAFRWKYMHDAEGGAYYCQFLLRFKNGFILHSIIYQSVPDSYHLIADTYNMLGKNRSDGCVRMLSGDAAWVYEHCGLGTQVTIYEDEWVTGPFDRPAIEQAIPRTQNYDPTDPVIIAEQQQSREAEEAAAAAQLEAVTGIEAAPSGVAP